MSTAAEQIIQICKDQWDAQKSNCSGFVEAVATQVGVTLTGDANDIYREIQGLDWTPIPNGIAAKEAADAGLFVIAALSGDQSVPEAVHGHVCVVVSGPIDSVHQKYPTGYWGQLGGVGKEFMTLNYAWNEASRDLVEYASIEPPKLDKTALTVTVNGAAVPTAAAYLYENEAYAWIRPVAEALGAQILSFSGSTVTVQLGDSQQDLSVEVEADRSFIHLGELRAFPNVSVSFDSAALAVAIVQEAVTD